MRSMGCGRSHDVNRGALGRGGKLRRSIMTPSRETQDDLARTNRGGSGLCPHTAGMCSLDRGALQLFCSAGHPLDFFCALVAEAVML